MVFANGFEGHFLDHRRGFQHPHFTAKAMADDTITDTTNDGALDVNDDLDDKVSRVSVLICDRDS